MDSVGRRTLTNAIRVFDLLLLVASFGLAALPMARAQGLMSFSQFLSLRIKVQNFVVFFVLLWIWNSIFMMLDLYNSKRMQARRSEAIDIVKATSLSALVLGLASVVIGFRMVTPTFIAVFWFCSTSVMVASRLAIRTYLRQLRRHGRNLRNMLIVGTNSRAVEFAKTIRSKPELGYRILGFADDEWAGAEDLRTNGWSVICNLQELPKFLRRSVVDEVVIAVPLRSFHNDASEIAIMCEQQGIMLHVLSDLFNLKNRLPRAEEVEGSHVITHSGGIGEGWPIVIKRAIDLTL